MSASQDLSPTITGATPIEALPAGGRTITISLETARLIYAAFLPLNPNKLRSATPRVIAAAKSFKAAVEAHGDPRAALTSQASGEPA